MFVTNVKDAYGYTLFTVYDYKWAALGDFRSQRNKMRYTYLLRDAQARLSVRKRLPGVLCTIKFEYHPQWSLCPHGACAPEGDIDLYLADSLMRAVQTKQTAGDGRQSKGVIVMDAPLSMLSVAPGVLSHHGSHGIGTYTTGDPQATTEYDVYDRTTRLRCPMGNHHDGIQHRFMTVSRCLKQQTMRRHAES